MVRVRLVLDRTVLTFVIAANIVLLTIDELVSALGGSGRQKVHQNN